MTGNDTMQDEKTVMLQFQYSWRRNTN